MAPRLYELFLTRFQRFLLFFSAAMFIVLPPRWTQMPLTVYLLKHRNGRLRFPGQFTAQHQFLTERKQANPGVELTGC